MAQPKRNRDSDGKNINASMLELEATNAGVDMSQIYIGLLIKQNEAYMYTENRQTYKINFRTDQCVNTVGPMPYM